ncbi:NAD(P)-dependent oxidoreductase [Rhodococcus sp. PAMC28707]|uniref:NAD-dependent epimerase/dehydratase family protein n=1 Tax=unclassified Rhodococcus (in: high G+C Gram-positive bacteria) TaxID=192944 RepID=UPI00109DB51E|nr:MULTISPECIES: NAD(P)-dependent oxidoreductase [unclassified Rhodococcus (in: high G+C Gram-positive bacteria)]QCB50318.1 NAD(P)-dependent oxidoreductase [Rhodococcus sp. PAMC28705]QCB57990.1 NAD(P)-dependent oxidoreductase [Rhodococcus sp. PAMC28707]
MKTLVVGGTGMIGTHIAAVLREQGNDITVAARTAPKPGSLASEFPVMLGDYSAGTFSLQDLAPFEAVVFAAGNDIRHIPRGIDTADFWEKTQSGGVPRFVALAKKAGVRRLVQIGSYYHQVLPKLVESNEYVAARCLADEGSRALADADFTVSTLNPPSILGANPGGTMSGLGKVLAWSAGNLPDIPNFAPAGGTNYMSARSLAEAVRGALQHGESKAYLIGDVNLTFREYFQTIFDAAGSEIQLEERDEEHPLLPDAFIVQGRGNTISYETDAVETATLGYTQGDVKRVISELVAATKARG